MIYLFAEHIEAIFKKCLHKFQTDTERRLNKIRTRIWRSQRPPKQRAPCCSFSVNIKLLLCRRLWELGAIQCKSKVENKLELRPGGLRPGRLILLHSAHLLPTVAIFVQLEVAVSCSPMLMSCVCV